MDGWIDEWMMMRFVSFRFVSFHEIFEKAAIADIAAYAIFVLNLFFAYNLLLVLLLLLLCCCYIFFIFLHTKNKNLLFASEIMCLNLCTHTPSSLATLRFFLFFWSKRFLVEAVAVTAQRTYIYAHNVII